MPDEPTTTDAPVTDPTTADAPPVEAAPYVFPFAVPTDFASVTEDDLRALHAQVREHATTLTGTSPAAPSEDALAGLRASRDLAVMIGNEITDRRDRAAEATALTDDLALDLPAVDVPVEGDTVGNDATVVVEPVVTAVTASRRVPPTVRQVARTTRSAAPALPDDRASASGSLTAASDFAGFSTGQQLDSFADAGRILSRRIDQYPSQPAPTRYSANKRPMTVYDPEGRRLEVRNYSRHAGVELRREFPDELRIRDESRGYEVAMHAASERRLPGGSLTESMRQQVAAGRSLTAAAGWCAPSPVLQFDLLELETMEGLLDTAELQSARGGFQIPELGGPDFATIYDAIGDSGETHLSEDDVIADTPKVSTEIPCPDFVDVRLGVDYFILTGSLLQRRGYPEVVARWSRAAATALAHKINAGYIAALVTASGAANILPSDPSGDDAVSNLLSGVELAVEDIRSRHRMGFGTTIEVVLPHWALLPLRAALSRRTGVALYNVTDAQLLDAFTTRGAVPHLVYDYQDAFTGLATGPGGATALTALPSTVDFLAYPAGTWIKAVQDVVSLDTIYDSTLLATNQYTAVMAEDGWAALQMGPTSRRYTARMDPSGVTGCCPGEEIS